MFRNFSFSVQWNWQMDRRKHHPKFNFVRRTLRSFLPGCFASCENNEQNVPPPSYIECIKSCDHSECQKFDRNVAADRTQHCLKECKLRICPCQRWTASTMYVPLNAKRDCCVRSIISLCQGNKETKIKVSICVQKNQNHLMEVAVMETDASVDMVTMQFV